MIAKLHIQMALKNDSSYLKKAFYTPPLKIADIREDKRCKTLQLMLMSSSPGILDEDDYEINIELAKGCSLQLETQSYQRLFAMQKGASQKMEVHVAEGSSFFFLPHPIVPHAASDFMSRNKIFLSSKCNLVWGEVLTCGRKLRGEVFSFKKYHSVTEIFLNNRLVIKENLFIQPAFLDVAAMGQLEGYTHQATLIYLNEKAAITDLTVVIIEWLTAQQGITYGVSALPVNGLIVRLFGQKGEQLYNCLKEIAQLLPMQEVKHLAEESIVHKMKVYAS